MPHVFLGINVPLKVALLAEGVGRNRQNKCPGPRAQVALLAEGVGRNAP